MGMDTTTEYYVGLNAWEQSWKVPMFAMHVDRHSAARDGWRMETDVLDLTAEPVAVNRAGSATPPTPACVRTDDRHRAAGLDQSSETELVCWAACSKAHVEVDASDASPWQAMTSYPDVMKDLLNYSFHYSSNFVIVNH